MTIFRRRQLLLRARIRLPRLAEARARRVLGVPARHPEAIGCYYLSRPWQQFEHTLWPHGETAAIVEASWRGWGGPR